MWALFWVLFQGERGNLPPYRRLEKSLPLIPSWRTEQRTASGQGGKGMSECPMAPAGQVDTASGESDLIIQLCFWTFPKIRIIAGALPNILVSAKKGNLLTRKNKKPPGVAGSWVKMRTPSFPTPWLCFSLWLVCFLCREAQHFHGQVSPNIWNQSVHS